MALNLGYVGAAVDEAAGHGAALGVIVLEHGQPQAGTIAPAAPETLRSFRRVPAVVEPAGGGGCRVDLFITGLAYIGDEQVAVHVVEREPPRIAKPEGPDLRTGAGLPDEGVVGGDGVGITSIDVDPEHDAE